LSRRALLSVTDKTGIVDFARELASLAFEIVSTGGTAAALREAGVPVTAVSDVTGFPEILDGRVKTLHPGVHGGLLADLRQASHRAALAEAEIQPIEILAVNLYAFEATVAGPHTLAEAVESIDIGGPAMVRAAAKNWANVTVLVDPADYGRAVEAVRAGAEGSIRQELAAKAFRHTAYYDSVISGYLTRASGQSDFAEVRAIPLRRLKTLRYGENPHQRGAVYGNPLLAPGIAQAKLLWGIEPGYNNYLDSAAAWGLACELRTGSCVIVKHLNPCGVCEGDDFAESFRIAKACDPISAFGGVVAMNGRIDQSAAEAMTEKGNKLDVIIGTEFSDSALEIFRDRSGWGQDVRLLAAPPATREVETSIRSLSGGALLQDTDVDPGGEWQIVTEKRPTREQMAMMKFAWRVIPHVTSNAIVVSLADRTLGIGAGQMNRVQSVRLALDQAGDAARGACLASDAFFPFPDSVEAAAEAGIAAICQPGGSKKDPDVIAEANRRGIGMAFTGTRHFRH